MLDTTLKIMDAALKADASTTAAQRSKILRLARNGESAEPEKNGNGHEPPRIYSREQAAAMVGGRTTRYIDQLCKRGLLQKFTPRGNQRAIGVTGESLTAFITGQPATIRV
jgi:hypothetical protein